MVPVGCVEHHTKTNERNAIVLKLLSFAFSFIGMSAESARCTQERERTGNGIMFIFVHPPGHRTFVSNLFSSLSKRLSLPSTMIHSPHFLLQSVAIVNSPNFFPISWKLYLPCSDCSACRFTNSFKTTGLTAKRSTYIFRHDQGDRLRRRKRVPVHVFM